MWLRVPYWVALQGGSRKSPAGEIRCKWWGKGETHPVSAPVTSLVTGVSMQHPARVSRSASLPWMKHCRPSYWIARLSLEGWKVTTKEISIPGEM